MKHSIVYHTTEGDYSAYGSLRSVEQMLPENWFVRCNSCYLVNLRYVTRVSGFTVTVGGDDLSVSHSKKREFMKALASPKPSRWLSAPAAPSFCGTSQMRKSKPNSVKPPLKTAPLPPL